MVVLVVVVASLLDAAAAVSSLLASKVDDLSSFFNGCRDDEDFFRFRSLNDDDSDEDDDESLSILCAYEFHSIKLGFSNKKKISDFFLPTMDGFWVFGRMDIYRWADMPLSLSRVHTHTVNLKYLKILIKNLGNLI